MSRFFIISGPSAVGKTTISRAVAERCDLDLGVSHTTRPQRKGERTGHDYFFVSNHEFDWLARIDALLEHVQYAGSGFRYGFMRRFWSETEAAGRDLIVVMEPRGCAMVREALGDAVVSIFLTPGRIPATEMGGGYAELVGRMTARGLTAEEIARRLEDAERQIQRASPSYHYTVPNPDGYLEHTIETVCGIVAAERERVAEVAR